MEKSPHLLTSLLAREAFWHRLWTGTILLWTVFLFWPSLSNGFVDWDDYRAILENPAVTSFDVGALLQGHTQNSIYAPVTWLSFALQGFLTGFDAAWFHGVDLALHLLCTALTGLVLHRVSPGQWLVVFVGMLLFGIHPIHVESVAWATERKDTLSTVFALLCLSFYMTPRGSKGPSFPVYMLSSLFFLLAVLSKPNTVVLPLLALGWDWVRAHRLGAKEWARVLPWLLVSVVIGLVNLRMQSTEAMVSSGEFPLSELLLAAPTGLLLYVFKSLVPVPLSHLYGEELFHFRGLEFAVVVLFVAATVYHFRRFKQDRETIVISLVFFVISISLTLRVIPFGDSQSLIHDRFLYFPSMGLFLLMSLLFVRAVETLRTNWRATAGIAMVLGLAYALWLSALTRKQVRVWKDSGSLWRHALAVNPDMPLAHKGLGSHLLAQGEVEEAKKHLLVALEGVSRESLRLDVMANLGIAHSMAGDNAAAIKVWEGLLSEQPGVIRPDIWTNLGVAYYQEIDLSRASKWLEKSLEFDPRNARILHNLGLVRTAQSRTPEALGYFLKAIEVDPYFGPSHAQLALRFETQGNLPKAREHAQRALELGTPLPGAVRQRLGIPSARSR